MLPQELALDRAWARAIAAAGILTHDEGQRIVAALDEIEGRAQSDAAWLDASKAEDVHHFAETALIEKLGPLGAKLHTGRSRNEMVATEFRMYVKDAAREMRTRTRLARCAPIAAQAKQNLGIPMPGTTHMQHAQPLLLSHWLLAHGEAFQRDAERFAAAAASADVLPAGLGRARRLRVSARSQGARARSGLFAHHRQQPRRRQRPRFRARISFRARHAGHASFAACRGHDSVRHRRIRLHRVARRILHRQQPDAAEEKSGLRGS